MALGLYGPEYLQFDEGGPAAEILIFVFLPGTKTKAQLFADKTGQYTGSNPVWTDRRGELSFFAEEGTYDLWFQYPEPDGTTIPIEVGADGGVIIIGGYEHHQIVPSTLVQVIHGLDWKPAGVISIDSLGVVNEYDQISYPGDGIIEIKYGSPFGPGRIYLS